MEDIEVPSHFLCPISLEIMRDPVTISTGITYDRETIEKWLFSTKNNTCPVTKQPLFDDDNVDLTPNHTLRRIIQAWCTLNASHGVERIPTPRSPLDKCQIVKLIEQAKKAPQTNLHCLRQLRSVVLTQSERHLSCLEAAGVIEFAASIINNGSDNSDTSTTEVAIEVLFLMKISETRLKDLLSNYDVVQSLVRALKCGNFKSRSHAIILLKSVFEVAYPGQLVNVDLELFRQIVLVLQDRISLKASKAALKLLVELYPWGRNRIKAVEGGAVFVLVECLLETNEKRICELILIVLDQLCGCAEGRAELLKHGAGIAVVSKKILRVSHVASDRAVRILSAVSRFSATNGVVQEMLQVGVVAKLCLVLQVDCRFKTKEKAREVLKLHSRVWKNSSCIPGHLLPFYPSSSS